MSEWKKLTDSVRKQREWVIQTKRPVLTTQTLTTQTQSCNKCGRSIAKIEDKHYEETGKCWDCKPPKEKTT